jgi:hypothetical protein
MIYVIYDTIHKIITLIFYNFFILKHRKNLTNK